jgi:hypothetical protein
MRIHKITIIGMADLMVLAKLAVHIASREKYCSRATPAA